MVTVKVVPALLLVSWLVIIALSMPEFCLANPNMMYRVEMVPIEHAYIRSNGEVDPPSMPIQREGDTYFFTDNIVNCSIEIQKDNVTLDGNGFSLTLPPSIKITPLMDSLKSGDPLLQISNRTSITIMNVTSNNYFVGIRIIGSSNIVLLENTLRDGRSGILVVSSYNCSIVGNKLSENLQSGIEVQHSKFLNIQYNNFSKNQYDGLQGYYLSYSNISRNNFFDNEQSGIYLFVAESNRIYANNIMKNEIGLFYNRFCSHNNNTVFNNYWDNYGLQIDNSTTDTVSGMDQSPLAEPITLSFDPSLFFPEIADSSSQEPFPATLVIGTFAVVIIAVAVSAFILKKSIHPTKQKQSSFILSVKPRLAVLD
ncbi:MAG: right-handed parallel beta-helix repeat-containing protein [Candidatus Bathyarchaeota archaeon]|nr:right-handed parallel beta-helix repeat-containing protein [Candidatus Bathyarchaeota archaeon]